MFAQSLVIEKIASKRIHEIENNKSIVEVDLECLVTISSILMKFCWFVEND